MEVRKIMGILHVKCGIRGLGVVCLIYQPGSGWAS